jgi:hypothetical protein
MLKEAKILFVLFLISSQVLSQRHCQCDSNLFFLFKKVESNYPGFTEKTINKKSYKLFKEGLRIKAASSENFYSCIGYLREYLDYFKDSHLSMAMNLNSTSVDSIKYIMSFAPSVKIDMDSINSYFSTRQIDSVEGIWELKNAQTKYKVAIQKRPGTRDDYRGIILEADNIFWKFGQIKMLVKKNEYAYSFTIFKRDHSPAKLVLVNINGALDMGTLGYWQKVFPATVEVNKDKPASRIQQLSDKTILISLPSFAADKKPEIDSMVLKNWELITKTKNLIIDLRGNFGGTGASYNTLLPLLYTGPMAIEAGRIIASDDNISYYRNSLLKSRDSSLGKESLKQMIATLESNKGKTVLIGGGNVYKLNVILPYPAKISIITDEQSASAAELFLLMAIQSKKVTTFGRNTLGAIDFANAIEKNDLPCNLIKYSYPLMKREGFYKGKIDNIGIKPSVILSYGQKDWIGYVRELMERQ